MDIATQSAPEGHLPGGACEIRLEPAAIIPLARTRLLHGAISHALARNHDTDDTWSLVPSRGGWTVVWHTDAGAARAGTEHAAHLYGQPICLRFGPRWRLRMPRFASRPHHRLRIDAVTPVVIRCDGSQTTRLQPDATSLRSTLSQTLGRRLGLVLTREQVALVVDEIRTEPVQIRGTGKYGANGSRGKVVGWTGSLVVHCDDMARLLLECAARGWGLGGRTSLGFGCIRVSDA
jgi:hypothetical protein